MMIAKNGGRLPCADVLVNAGTFTIEKGNIVMNGDRFHLF